MNHGNAEHYHVLILILMECSLGTDDGLPPTEDLSLNPYSNGMLTWARGAWGFAKRFQLVLILILMECSLGFRNMGKCKRMKTVLILILMECSLGRFEPSAYLNVIRLNPYSNGMLTWNKRNT